MSRLDCGRLSVRVGAEMNAEGGCACEAVSVKRRLVSAPTVYGPAACSRRARGHGRKETERWEREEFCRPSPARSNPLLLPIRSVPASPQHTRTRQPLVPVLVALPLFFSPSVLVLVSV